MSQHKTNLLIVAHNHPTFFPGGAEILAYEMFRELRQQGSYEPTFLGATGRISSEIHHGTPFQVVNDHPDEFLFWGDPFDYFAQSNRILPHLYTDFVEFLEERRPQIVHFHHTLRIGVEAIKVVRNVVPEAKVFYTFHDFIPICHRDGQMVRTLGEELCNQANPMRCHQCFPEIPAARFKLRDHWIKTHFDLIDCFITPGEFFAQRYREWGIPDEKLQVVPNGHRYGKAAPHRPVALKDKRNRFAFFGQLTPYKGVQTLLKACKLLMDEGYKDFQVDIYGNLALQMEEFRNTMGELMEQCKPNVMYHGAYKHEDMHKLMHGADWVVVPSTWWENSPLVIGEAFYHDRPVICSDIGGMAEHVKHGVDGLHFQVKNPRSLAETMKFACEDQGIWKTLIRNIRPPKTIADCVRHHEELYSSYLHAA